MVKRLCIASVVIFIVVNGCGVPPNTGVLTRVESYDKAMHFPSDGEPVDIDALVEKYPQLRGRVMTATQYMDKYAKDLEEAKRQGKSLFPFRIPIGTHIDIEFVGEKDLGQQIYVGPHGYDDLILIGKMTFVERTVEEIREELTARYSKFLKKPEILLHVKAPALSAGGSSQFGFQMAGYGGITVLGASQSNFNRQLRLTGGESLVEILGIAGLPQSAEWRAIRVIRRDPADPLNRGIIIFCDVWDYFFYGDVRQDIPLIAGDVVYVPIKWSLGDQVQKDWNLILSYMSGAFGVDAFIDAFEEDGAFRD